MLIVADAAQFFFPQGVRHVALTEVRLNDVHGKSAGNIDIVLVALDEQNQIIDFGALEVQAVYISGNVSKAFKEYMRDPEANYAMEWPSKNYPTPDYLSSSRKRLAPQLIYKGGILNTWRKKMAVAVHRAFFDQLPPLKEVDQTEAEIAWFVYDLKYDTVLDRYKLERAAATYTKFRDALDTIATPEPGDVNDFVSYLNARVRTSNLMGTPPQSELPPDVEPLPHVFGERQGDADNEHMYEDGTFQPTANNENSICGNTLYSMIPSGLLTLHLFHSAARSAIQAVKPGSYRVFDNGWASCPNDL